MARPALFLTLIAATLAGPLFCCCTFARAFSLPTPKIQAAATETEPACPHCRKASGPGTQRPASAPPTDPAKNCPCCVQRAAAVAVAPQVAPRQVPESVQVGTVPVLSQYKLTESIDASGRSELHGSGVQAFLLDSCHRLRC